MGVDHTAYLAVGALEEKLFTIRTDVTYIKKYNTDTGEPYMYPVTQKVLLLCGKPLEDVPDDREHWAERRGLQYCSCRNGAVYGRILAEIGGWGSKTLESVMPEAIVAETAKAEAALRALGYEGQIGMHLVMNIG